MCAGLRAKFRLEHNLNDPLPVRYGKYIGNVAQGDLGTTFRDVKVADELKQRYPTTAKLAGMAIVFETIIGVIAGVLAGIRKGKFMDNLVLVSTLFVIAIPIFVIGATLQYYLGVKAQALPGHGVPTGDLLRAVAARLRARAAPRSPMSRG